MAKTVDIGKFVKDTSYTKKQVDDKLEDKADADHRHDNATTEADGFISKEDKAKLNGIASQANKYIHPSYTAKSNGLYKITVDNTGHVSGTNPVSGNDLPSHSHTTSEVSDENSNTYNNIGTLSSGATQRTINNAINTSLGGKANNDNVYTKSQTMTKQEITNAIAQGVSNLELLRIVTALPQSNIDTNKIYLVTDTITGDKDLYVYVNGSWEQLDSLEFHTEDYYDKSTINTYLSGKENITNKASSITNDSTKYPSNAAVYSALNGKSDSGHTHDNRYYTETEIDSKLENVLTYDVVEDTLDDDSSYPIRNGTVSKAIKTKADTSALNSLSESVDSSLLNLSNQLTQAGNDINSINIELTDVLKKGDVKGYYTTDGNMPVKASVLKQDLDSKIPLSDGAEKVRDYNYANYTNINPAKDGYNNWATQKSINTAINTRLGEYIKNETGTVTSTNILNETIINEDIAPNAAINFSKLDITRENIMGLGLNSYNIGFIDDDFNLFLGDTSLNGLDITAATKGIIQKNDTITLAGFSNQGSKLYFYEVYTPSFTLTSDKSIIQTQDTITLHTTLKDATDGNRIDNQKVYFYEVYTPTLTVASDKNVIQTNQKADITAKIQDTDGNLIPDQEVYFYEVSEPTSIEISSDLNTIQINDTTILQAILKDEDGSRIAGATVEFYIDENEEE